MLFRSPWPDFSPPQISVPEVLLAAAGHVGEKPALIDGETGESLSYRDLVEGMERAAAGFAHAGVKPRDAVMVALPNSFDFALAWFGALRAGAWVVPVSPLYTAAEMEHQVRDSGARFLVTVPERASLASAVDAMWIAGSSWNELLANSHPRVAVSVRPADMAALPYSSGTTGKPKGVILTHGNIIANIHQIHLAGCCLPDSIVVNMMPFYHAAGLVHALNGLIGSGGTQVLMRRFDLETWLRLMEKYRATELAGPPPVILGVTKSPLWESFRLDRIRQAVCGAAPLGADLHRAFEQRTGILLSQIWGMTEATAVVTVTPNDPARRKFGSCGYLVASCEARVIDTVSGKELGANEPGELCIRGPNIMQGYWNQPQATAEAISADGWLHTGDIGYFDSDGCVYVVDRLKELIKYNALQVAPAELEDIIQSHPAVSEAAVIGTPDETAGEIPTAFVVRKPYAELEAEGLMEYVAARVAPHKKVRAVEFVEAIPKSPAGKILRRVLKERVRAEQR